jgi:ketosteroid isomerase-like protein
VPPAETAPPRTSDTARVPEPEPEPDPPPAPTPPPREPAREAAPAPQPVSDDQLIRGTLDAYAEAYRRLDVAAVQRVFPTVDRATLQRGFAQADSQEVQISDIRIEVAGNRATVRCRVFQRIDLKAGNEGTVNEQTVFQMEKRGDRWVIVRRSAS